MRLTIECDFKSANAVFVVLDKRQDRSAVQNPADFGGIIHQTVAR